MQSAVQHHAFRRHSSRWQRCCAVVTILLTLLLGSHGLASEEAGFRVLPESLELTGEGAKAKIIAQSTQDGEFSTQLHDVKAESSDPAVAIVKDGLVVARGNGKAEIVVNDGTTSVTVQVSVAGCEEPRRWQFDAHVQSILSRQGCNSGACHGALAGKGGFRLSLRGYDSQADHFTMTRQDRGRRIEPADPGRSLLLAKPTSLVPHKGGLRLPPESEEYQVLAEWIQNGADGPLEQDAPLSRIEVLPNAIQLNANDSQELIVRAHYADGRIEDVTRWAKFSSQNETVASVGDDGVIEVVGHGKGAVVVWFASRIAISSITVPYDQQVTQVAYQDFRPANVIDEILLEEWKSLNLAPSARCTDETYLRRVYLDVTGTLPTPETVRAFVGDSDPAKRIKVADELLSSESFVDYWAYQWSDLLLVNGNLLRPDAVASFYKWIRERVKDNTPWDEFAEAVVLARGESMEQGATNFYAIHQDPESLTENTCLAFMGLSIGCAKCHNHPLEKWTNDQYYAMANLYARVRAKGWGGDARNGDGKRTLVVLDRGDVIQPSRGVPQPPAPLDAEPIKDDFTGDRRAVLADWLTSDQNEYFRRSIVNRVWANYMGVGLVESVDDLRVSNPASSERLLDALSDFLVENDYDLKALMRLILQSQTYQRSAEPNDFNRADERFYCRYYPRRLMAEVMHDAIVSVTGVPTTFNQIEFPGADKRETEFYPEGTRSIELYDSAVVSYFLKTFGRHQRRITCDCERSNQPTVVQVLHLNNGDTMNDKLSAKACVVTEWKVTELPLDQVVEDAYLLALSRFPSTSERARVSSLIQAADQEGVSRSESYQDLLWSLMTSSEFLFKH